MSLSSAPDCCHPCAAALHSLHSTRCCSEWPSSWLGLGLGPNPNPNPHPNPNPNPNPNPYPSETFQSYSSATTPKNDLKTPQDPHSNPNPNPNPTPTPAATPNPTQVGDESFTIKPRLGEYVLKG